MSVVCRSCGSEVSPYVTECPYCGHRLRKRAPRLEREGDEIKVRESRRDRRRRRRAERAAERAASAAAGRPLATGVTLLAGAVLLVIGRAVPLT
ncbi:MAG TPA: zinc-ribbon domain-containing protein, partial [Solirubrobacterales bacterium]|nr:zinc-ribbon domain-containing protein [Solirubrobacterales bacterium]